MASALEVMAAKIRFPNDKNRTVNDFGVVKVTVAAGAAVEQKLPAEWSDRFVYIFPETAGVIPQVAIAVTSAAASTSGRDLDVAAAASAAGATSLKAGCPCPPQQLTPLKLPFWDKGTESGWLLVDTATNTSLIVVLAS